MTYRMLKKDEIVKIDDEVFVGDPINKWLKGSLNVGKKLPANKVGLYRRKLLKKPKPLCKTYRLCKYKCIGYCGGTNSNTVSQLGCYK